MRQRFTIFCCILLLAISANAKKNYRFYPASDKRIQYTGRIDFTRPALPRFWTPGVYITIRFRGSYCELILNDEVLYGSSHNYIEVVVDGSSYRQQTRNKTDTIRVKPARSSGEHVITICKSTEAGIGYLEFAGLRCEKLLTPPAKPTRKIEFIGNSITCGASSDLREIPCGKGVWYDQTNAYLAYGPITARTLNAQWHLSSISGIGLIHSCCNRSTVMPQLFDKTDLRSDSLPWDFSRYQPDVVTVCLGQNDGIQDSTAFCSAYITFINRLRAYYPSASIVCLNSPMGDEALTAVLKRYIRSIVTAVNQKGDSAVHAFFFSRRFSNGCGSHPDLQEHKEIARELTACLKGLKNW